MCPDHHSDNPVCRYHVGKQLFLVKNELPSHFDYAKYLRKLISRVITDRLDISETSWLFMLFFVGLNVCRMYLIHGPDGDYGFSSLIDEDTIWTCAGGAWTLWAVRFNTFSTPYTY